MYKTTRSPSLVNSVISGYEGLIADTPMRKLQVINRRADVSIFGKLEGTNLGGSVKDRAALGMINGAESAGVLRDGRKLVEATSGNTGIALAMIAARFSHRRTSSHYASIRRRGYLGGGRYRSRTR